MKKISLAVSLLCIGCVGYGNGGDGDGDTPDTDDPECQIQTEGEKNPGYPFDLELFREEVLPVVTENCATAGCHAAPEGQGNFTLWAEAAPGNCEYAKTFNEIAGAVDLANPTNSPIYVSISGGNPAHPLSYPVGDDRLDAVLSYVTDASDRYLSDGGNGDTAPPGASPFDYAVFQSTIQPIIDTAEGRGCALAGCHADAAGNFTLVANPAADSVNMENNFKAVTSRTNLETPEASLFYTMATNRHGSGASSVATPEEGRLILEWIAAAAEAAGDDATPPSCASLENFNVGVFRDEILPILRGDIDYNNPGSRTTGCTLGPCHGTERGPGTLYLSETLDAASNLQNFACFVDLASPSSSNILLCPLDDPRCPKNPHPGQDVFDGANDLNYQKVLAYLLGSKVQATPLDYAFFVRRINPIFNDLNAVEGGAQGRTCADTVACHGVAVVGQEPPNGSNFPIIPNATDSSRLAFNFASAGSFVNFLNADQSSLFLYPTNEIANIADNPLATGLPHPGGADFAVDSNEALSILKWAAGLRPDRNGFVREWLVAGDYPATLISDPTPIDEASTRPKIFDPTGATQFNNGQWDGLFSDNAAVDLNDAFPRAATNGRIAYAAAYVTNISSSSITATLNIDSDNALRVYVDSTLVAQSEGGTPISAVATLPSHLSSDQPVRILIKILQRADDPELAFTAQLRDELGNPLTDATGELIIKLGPEGGI